MDIIVFSLGRGGRGSHDVQPPHIHARHLPYSDVLEIKSINPTFKVVLFLLLTRTGPLGEVVLPPPPYFQFTYSWSLVQLYFIFPCICYLL